MHFQSLLLLAVAAPLVLGAPNENGIERRTGDDDIKDKDVLIPATFTLPAASIHFSSHSDMKDKSLPLPSVQFYNNPKTVSSPDKAKAIMGSMAMPMQSTSVAKKGESTGLADYSKDLFTSMAFKDDKVLSTSTLTDGKISSLSTSTPSKDNPDYLKADNIPSKDDKFIYKDDKSSSKDDKPTFYDDKAPSKDNKTLSLSSSSTSFDSRILGSLTVKDTKSSISGNSHASVNDKTSSLQDKDKGFFMSLSTVSSKTAGKDKEAFTSLPLKDEKLQYLSGFDKVPGTIEIVYSITVPFAHSSSPAPSNQTLEPFKLQVSTSHSAKNSSTGRTTYLTSPPQSTVSFEKVPTAEFPGYQIVPSPTEAPSKGFGRYTASATPVYTPALLGNAYGGGFVITPSIYVSKRPFPNGPSEGVPPGYDSYSKPEFSFANSSLPSTSIPDKDRTFGFSVPGTTSSFKAENSGFGRSMAGIFSSGLGAGASRSEIVVTLNSKEESKSSSPTRGINGGKYYHNGTATSAKTMALETSSQESSPSVRYITEKASTTVTYHPITTVSGKTVVVSSITLTETLSIVTVMTISETENSSLPQITGATSLGISSSMPSNGGLGLSPSGIPLPTFGAPFLNSTVLTGTYTEQSITSKLEFTTDFAFISPSKGAKFASGSLVLVESGTSIELIETSSSLTELVSGSTQARPTTFSTAASSLSNEEATLSGTTITGSETISSQLNGLGKASSEITKKSLPNTGVGTLAPISNSAVVSFEVLSRLGSSGSETSAEITVAASLSSGLSLLPTSGTAPIPTTIARISLLGSNLASLLNSTEVIEATKSTGTELPGSKLPLQFGTVGPTVSTQTSLAILVGPQSLSLLSLSGVNMPTSVILAAFASPGLSSASSSSEVSHQTGSKVAVPLGSTLFQSSSTPPGTARLSLFTPGPIVSPESPVGSIAALANLSTLTFQVPYSPQSINGSSFEASIPVSIISTSALNEHASSAPAVELKSGSGNTLGSLLSPATSTAQVSEKVLVVQPASSASYALPPAGKSTTTVSATLQDSKSPTQQTFLLSLFESAPKTTILEQGTTSMPLVSPLEIIPEKSEIVEGSKTIPHASTNAKTTESGGALKSAGLGVSTIIEAAAFGVTIESLTTSPLSLGALHNTLEASRSEASLSPEIQNFAVTKSQNALGNNIIGISETTIINLSLASASQAFPTSSTGGLTQVSTAQESEIGASLSIPTPKSSAAFEGEKGEGEITSPSRVIQPLTSVGASTASEILQASTHALPKIQTAIPSGTIESTEASRTLVSTSNSAHQTSLSPGLTQIIASNEADLKSKKSLGPSNLGAKDSTTAGTSTLLKELHGPSTSNTHPENLHGPSPPSSTMPSEEAGSLSSSSSILTSAVPNTSGESAVEVGNSIATSGSPILTTQIRVPTGLIPLSGTQARITSIHATNTYDTSNNVSIIIKPTAVLPFLGSGARIPASCTFVLVAILATFIFVQYVTL